MRHLSKILVLTVLLSLPTLAQTSKDLLGSWTSASNATEWTFRPDGTGFIKRSKPRMTARFSWSLRGSVLTVSTAGTAVPYQVVRQAPGKLLIKNPQGARKYKLIRR